MDANTHRSTNNCKDKCVFSLEYSPTWVLQHVLSLIIHKFLPDTDAQWLLPCWIIWCVPSLLCGSSKHQQTSSVGWRKRVCNLNAVLADALLVAKPFTTQIHWTADDWAKMMHLRMGRIDAYGWDVGGSFEGEPVWHSLRRSTPSGLSLRKRGGVRTNSEGTGLRVGPRSMSSSSVEKLIKCVVLSIELRFKRKVLQTEASSHSELLHKNRENSSSSCTQDVWLCSQTSCALAW